MHTYGEGSIVTALANAIVFQVAYQHCLRMNLRRCGPINRDDFMQFNAQRWSRENIMAKLISRLQPGRLKLREGYDLRIAK